MKRRFAASALAIAAALLMTGCSAGGAAQPSGSPSPSTGTIGPVIVDLDDDLDGTTVTVEVDRMVDLDADEPEGWSATIADPSIAEFVPGGTEGDATFNPGLHPLAAGSTEVTLTNGADTVSFTLEVTE